MSVQNSASPTACAGRLPISLVMIAASSAERSVKSSAIRVTIAARSASGRLRHCAKAAVAAARACSTSASVANGKVSATLPVAGSVTWYGGGCGPGELRKLRAIKSKKVAGTEGTALRSSRAVPGARGGLAVDLTDRQGELVGPQDHPGRRRPVEIRGPRESGRLVEVLGGPHGRLGAQPQAAQPALVGGFDDGEQQAPSDAAALALRGDGERAEVRLGLVPGELAGGAERLEGDRAEETGSGLIGRDEDRAVGPEAESPQRLDVVAALGEQPECLVGGDPQVADGRVLVGPRLTNDHPMDVISPDGRFRSGG